MAIKTVSWSTKTPLWCGSCSPLGWPVHLCVPTEKIRQKACENLPGGTTDFPWQTIEASISGYCVTGSVCKGSSTYNYNFAYDDSQIVPGQFIDAVDISGVSCGACIEKLIKDFTGNDVYIKEVDDTPILVNQHGCEFELLGGGGVTPPPPTPTTPYLAQDIVAFAPGSCLTVQITTTSGLIPGMLIALETGTYRIDSLINPASMVICNDGQGAAIGTIIEYKDIHGNWIAPITAIPSMGNIIYSDNFDTGSIAAFWTTDGVDPLNYTPNTTAKFIENSPGTHQHSGAYSARYHLRGTAAGGLNEQFPFKLEKLIAPSSWNELCVEYWQYVEPGYPWPASSQKMVRIGHDDSNSALNYMVGILASFSNALIGMHAVDNQVLREQNETWNFPVPEGAWHKYGLYVKINTPGQADGIASFYMDGIRIIHMPAVEHRVVGQSAFNYFWIGANYSNTNAPPPSDGDIYYDDIVVYDGLPYPAVPELPVAEDDFTTGTLASFWYGGEAQTVDATMYAPNTAVDPFNIVDAQSGMISADYHAIEGTNERQPLYFQLYRSELEAIFGARPEEIYFEWWEKYTGNPKYPFPVYGSQKLIRFGYFDGNDPVPVVGDTSEDWFTDFVVFHDNTYIGFVFFAPGGIERNYTPLGAVELNQWIQWGVHIRLESTPGAYDGIFRLYKNRVLYTGGANLGFGLTKHPINTIWLGGNYSMGDSHKAVARYRKDNATVATLETQAPHNLQTGMHVNVSGCINPVFNSTNATVEKVTDTIFNYTNLSMPGGGWTIDTGAFVDAVLSNDGDRRIDNIKIYRTIPF